MLAIAAPLKEATNRQQVTIAAWPGPEVALKRLFGDHGQADASDS
jgi:hypothetical protein